MTVPYWVQDAIFYQIFPDRFANGDPSNDPPNVKAWGSPPTIWDFQGGDLRGVIQRLDYLLDLGVNAIYLNPIFQATSTHRYNTSDYFQIDPKLGTLADFRALLDAAHRNGMRVIIDGVFNHCGRGFFAFADLLENGEHSPYKDWFHVKKFPLDAYGHGDAENYLAWWKFKSLPKFNTDNPAVRRYVMDVARYWIEQGADGWRLDVPNEIDDDAFWAEFRQTVKAVNPDAYLLGEIWTADPRWADDAHFDGLMNYPVRDALLPFLNEKLPASQFAEKVEGLFKIYPRENIQAMYLTLGTHDTERMMTVLGHSLDKAKLAFAFLFAYPGTPAIYYGDEVGLEGGKDPDCRRAFPWDSADWKGDLRPWVRHLIGLRKKMPSLRRGEYVPLLADDRLKVYAFARILGEEKVICVVNASGHTHKVNLEVQKLDLPEQTRLKNLLDGISAVVEGRQVHFDIQPWSGLWLA